MYGRSASVYGPYGGYGRAASYNPETGTYARGRAMWDSDEIAGSAIGYNPRTGTGVATNRYRNEYGGFGQSVVTHNDNWLATRSQWDQDSRTTQFRTSGGTTGEITREDRGDFTTGTGEFQRGDQSLDTRSIRGDDGGSLVGYETGDGDRGFVGRSEEGDLYAGKDGNVYRRDEDGWSQRGEDGWEPVEVPDDAAARVEQRRNAGNENRAQAGSMQSQGRESFERLSGEQAQAALQQRGFAGNRASTQGSARSYDANRYRSTFDNNRRSELNRSYNARNSGYQRFSNRQSFGGGRAGSRPMPRRRRF